MANTFKFGNGEWARKTGQVLAYNSENDNYKPLPFTFDRASSATRVNKEGLIETVAIDEPRIDFLNNSKGHLLLEPQSTNRTLNSEQPSTWHSSNGMTITANATTSPDGTSNASLAVRNASSGGIYTRNRFIFTTETGTQTVTGSYFVKYYNNQWVRLKSVFFTGSPANSKCSFFDIQNGVLGTVDASHTAKIEDYGNGWYRCSITFDIDKDVDNNGYINIEPMTSDDTDAFAAIGQGYYAYGSQGEELSYPTSYIPTSGSAVTRSKDDADNTSTEVLTLSNQASFYWYVKGQIGASDLNNTGYTMRYNLNSSTDGFSYVALNTNPTQWRIRLQSSTASNFRSTTVSKLEDAKIVVTVNTSTFSIYANGALILSEPYNGDAITFENIRIQFDMNNENKGTVNVVDTKAYNTELTQAEAIALTTL